MRRATLAIVCLACASAGQTQAPGEGPLATAEAYIDAFYSFDAGRLRAALADAPDAVPNQLYYQGWAEGGHYLVLKRMPCRVDKPNEVSCAITVKDDLIPALGTGYDVTDVFHFAFRDGRIVKVWNSSDDPPELMKAMTWLRQERPEIFAGPCRDMFRGGPTPGDCIRAVVKGIEEFTKGRPKDGLASE